MLPLCKSCRRLGMVNIDADFGLGLKKGFGLHAKDVQGMTFEEANSTTKEFFFFFEHAYAFTLFFAKVSILSFYWRMFRVTNIKIAIRILAGCSVIWILARVCTICFRKDIKTNSGLHRRSLRPSIASPSRRSGTFPLRTRNALSRAPSSFLAQFSHMLSSILLSWFCRLCKFRDFSYLRCKGSESCLCSCLVSCKFLDLHKSSS